MKRTEDSCARPPALLEGVLVAAAASLLAVVACFALSLFFPTWLALRAATSLLALAYVVYLLARSAETSGRSSVIAAWLVVVFGSVVLDLGLLPYVVSHLGLAWLVRSLYFHSSLLSSVADLCLTGLALAAAAWTATQTGSVFMTTWCLFLVQALFCLITFHPTRDTRRATSEANSEDRFERAYRSAEEALRKLLAAR